jgi:hypothetical protein
MASVPLGPQESRTGHLKREILREVDIGMAPFRQETFISNKQQEEH